MRQPIRKSAARTRRALVAGQLLTKNLKRYVEGGGWQLAVLDSIGDDIDRQALGVTDGFLTGRAVAHRPRQFQGFRDPTTVIFPIELNRNVHSPSIATALRYLLYA